MALPAQHDLGPLRHIMGAATSKYILCEYISSFISPRFFRLFAASCVLLISVDTAIAHPASTRPPSLNSSHTPLTQTGMASWYGGNHFSGKHTASGETFRPEELTAAHRTLPLGTRILVQSPQTGQSVIVRVNDRGPFAKNRILDLSKEAASRLHIVQRGVGLVTLTVLPQ